MAERARGRERQREGGREGEMERMKTNVTWSGGEKSVRIMVWQRRFPEFKAMEQWAYEVRFPTQVFPTHEQVIS